AARACRARPIGQARRGGSMTFDVLLLTAALMAGYLGQMVLRRMGPGQRTYGLMLLGTVVLAVVALVARRDDGGELGDLLGTIAVGLAVCLVVVPTVLRDLGRRAAAGDRLRLARAVCELRELFQ